MYIYVRINLDSLITHLDIYFLNYNNIYCFSNEIKYRLPLFDFNNFEIENINDFFKIENINQFVIERSQIYKTSN